MNWISVKDRLPENGERVLIYFDCPSKDHLHKMIASDPCSEVIMGIYCEGWGSIASIDGTFSDREEPHFAHWMPLPKGPSNED